MALYLKNGPAARSKRKVDPRDLLNALGKSLGLAAKIGVEGLASGVISAGKATPVVGPICVGLEKMKEAWDKVKYRKELLMELHGRCTVLTTWVVLKCAGDSSCQVDVTPLADCVAKLNALVTDCSKDGIIRIRTNGKIEWLEKRIDDLVKDMGLGGVIKVSEQVDNVHSTVDDLKVVCDKIATDMAEFLVRVTLNSSRLPHVGCRWIRRKTSCKLYRLRSGVLVENAALAYRKRNSFSGTRSTSID